MKKLISIILTLSILACISAPAFAYSNDLLPVEMIEGTYASSSGKNSFTESYDYVDSLGDVYHVTFSKSSTKTTTMISDEYGALVAKSEYVVGNDYITNITPVASRTGEGSTLRSDIVSVDQYVKDDSEFDKTFTVHEPLTPANQSYVAAITAGGDSIPGSTTFKFYKTYNSDYVYQGEILKGDGYYRRLSGYDEYNRASYAFQKGAAIAVIFTILGGVYSMVTSTSTILDLAGGMGISIIGAALGMDWNLNACVRSFDFQFQCRMVYNGSTKTMSQITRQLEYLYGYDDFIDAESYVFDSFSYGSPEQAVSAHCSEAVGYGAAAFNAKYISCSYPTLVLPVSGPSWDWVW